MLGSFINELNRLSALGGIVYGGDFRHRKDFYARSDADTRTEAVLEVLDRIEFGGVLEAQFDHNVIRPGVAVLVYAF